jgi:hypothetical protein
MPRLWENNYNFWFNDTFLIMELSFYSANSKKPTNYKFITNYSFSDLVEKYLAATGLKKLTSSKKFIDFCVENGYIQKQEIETL